TKTENTHAIQLFRYAEILLNYAEAKAEQGTLTDADWANTIGALRKRAGITGGLNTKPTVADRFLKDNFYPDISDPVILEIRRERAVELLLEGFRFDDLRRWKCGELMKKSWTGMYIPAVNKALDMDKNGTYDVIYYTSTDGLNAAKEAIGEADARTCATVQVSADPASPSIQIREAGNGIGYYLTWFTHNDNMKVWSDKQYYYPIPVLALTNNPNLVQNAGWGNGATNDGN
ncbi:MAG: RagB/SusD family nutrient uptake outer membrane protein, partial [Tannerella sp.]|nr:RagB/SusD family nutrient uptake outer membrane protein [Tannerella sp.]